MVINILRSIFFLHYEENYKSTNYWETRKKFFIESPSLASENSPRNYEEYLKRSIEYAEKYGLDAIPISQKFNNKKVNREIMLEILSNRETPVGLGITYYAPFTRTTREIGLTNFLLLNIKKVMSVFK